MLVNVDGKYAVVNIDTDPSKPRVEVVGWRWSKPSDVDRIKKRAILEGGQVLITDNGAAGLSALQDDSGYKDTNGVLYAPDIFSGGKRLDRVQNSCDSIKIVIFGISRPQHDERRRADLLIHQQEDGSSHNRVSEPAEDSNLLAASERESGTVQGRSGTEENAGGY